MNVDELKTSDRHCVFRAGDATYAVSALSVREIAERPPLVSVPHSPAGLAGLCHFRNEFLPVINLQHFFYTSPADAEDDSFMLVLSGNEGNWALLINRGLALEPLEIAYVDSGGTAQVLVGTARYREEVVQIIDADCLYRQAVSLLEERWQPNGRNRLHAV